MYNESNATLLLNQMNSTFGGKTALFFLGGAAIILILFLIWFYFSRKADS